MGSPSSSKKDRPFPIGDRRSRLRSGSFLSSSTDSPLGETGTNSKNRASRKSTDDGADAEYKLFLEHLRVDGKSYVLEITSQDGSPLILRYEEDDDSSEVIQSDSTRSPKKKPRTENSSPNEIVDDSYQIFLKHVGFLDGTMVLQLENNVVVRYEEEVSNHQEEAAEERHEECLEESEVTEKKGDSFKPPSSLIQIVDDDSCPFEINSRLPSRFKSRLINVLRKPFDQSEYDNLKATATLRKKIIKMKHLRDRSIAYETNMPGYSYFDHYPDLARQIDCADRKKGLELLRGFFFWLENVGHEGAFMPWVTACRSYREIPYSDCKATFPRRISN
ncbi:uncharacterized protein [Typha latifolia]|uniref:uncharacterized protein n=1 Tax=Typha latifolia TaxID=4733 RepID=UPI003C2F5B46